MGARAVAGIAEAKEWAWNEALHNDELTNMQLGIRGPRLRIHSTCRLG